MEEWEKLIVDVVQLLDRVDGYLDEAYLNAEETNNIILDMHGTTEDELDRAMVQIDKASKHIEQAQARLMKLMEGNK